MAGVSHHTVKSIDWLSERDDGALSHSSSSLPAVISAVLVLHKLLSSLISLPQLPTTHHPHSPAQTSTSLILVQLCEFQKFSGPSACPYPSHFPIRFWSSPLVLLALRSNLRFISPDLSSHQRPNQTPTIIWTYHSPPFPSCITIPIP